MSLPTMYVGQSGMLAAGDGIRVVSNNVANAETNAFKRGTERFSDVFYNIVRQSGSPVEPSPGLGLSLGMGVQLAGTETDFRRGPIVTGQPMDVAIDGDGFFRVVDTDGNVFYTRLGSFLPKTPQATGPLHLELSQGVFTVEPPLVLPGDEGELSVTPIGEVVQGDSVAGRFELVRFRNPQGLRQVGDVLFAETPASGPEIAGNPQSPGFGATVGGVLEGSNVDISNELVDLLTLSRAFNVSGQSFRAGNEQVLRTIELARSA